MTALFLPPPVEVPLVDRLTYEYNSKLEIAERSDSMLRLEKMLIPYKREDALCISKSLNNAILNLQYVKGCSGGGWQEEEERQKLQFITHGLSETKLSLV